MLKIGDKVIAIADIPEGHIGYITYRRSDRAYPLFLIDFVDWNEGHGGLGYHNTSRSNNGWYLPGDQIKLIESATPRSMSEV